MSDLAASAARIPENSAILDRRLRVALLIVAHSVLGILVVLASLQYRERLFGDPSLYLWEVMNWEKPMIPHGRYSVAIMQLPPLTLTRMQAPLWLIASTYSAMFILYPWLLFTAIAHILRRPLLAVPIPLVLTVNTAHSYFWAIMEPAQSVCTALLLLAILDLRPRTRTQEFLQAVSGAVVAAISMLFHNLGVPVVAVVTVLSVAMNRRRWPAAAAIIVVVAAYGLFKAYTHTSYEARMSQTRSDLFSSVYLNELGVFLRDFVLPNYAILVPLFAAGAIQLYRLRMRLTLAVLLVSGVALTVLPTTTKIGMQNSVYILEQRYAPVVVICVLPAVLALQRSPGHVLGLIALASMAAGSALGILRSQSLRPQHLETVAYLVRLARAEDFEGSKRLVYSVANFPQHLDIASWGLFHAHFQSWLVTLIDDPQRGVTVARDYRLYKAKEHFEFRISNTHYFSRGGIWTPLNVPGDLRDLTRERMSAVRLAIESPERGRLDRKLHVNVKIENNWPTPLRSGLSPYYNLFITWQWLKDGRVLQRDQGLIPLEVDVTSEYRQPLHIPPPPAEGEYELMLDLVATGWRRFGVSAKAPVHFEHGGNRGVSERFLSDWQARSHAAPSLRIVEDLSDEAKIWIRAVVESTIPVDRIEVRIDGGEAREARYPVPIEDGTRAALADPNRGFVFRAQRAGVRGAAELEFVGLSAGQAICRLKHRPAGGSAEN